MDETEGSREGDVDMLGFSEDKTEGSREGDVDMLGFSEALGLGVGTASIHCMGVLMRSTAHLFWWMQMRCK